MKDYYYLTGKDQNGPFTLDELKTKKLTRETLMWAEGMNTWEKIKDIPELMQELALTSIPPPPPNEKNINNIVSGELMVTTKKASISELEAIKPSKETITWLIVWSAFHFFALIMSYTKIPFFNDKTEYEGDGFWPFVDFYSKGCWDVNGNPCFDGVFYLYDWSEFAFYMGSSIMIFLLIKINSNNTK